MFDKCFVSIFHMFRNFQHPTRNVIPLIIIWCIDRNDYLSLSPLMNLFGFVFHCSLYLFQWIIRIYDEYDMAIDSWQLAVGNMQHHCDSNSKKSMHGFVLCVHHTMLNALCDSFRLSILHCSAFKNKSY